MSHPIRAQLQILFATCVTAGLLLVGAASAVGATIVNGDFETGTLSGWQVVNDPPPPGESGSWFAYSGTKVTSFFEPTVPPPPAGTFAAITNQGGPGTHILYQDVALEPYYSHQLSLYAYYRSFNDTMTAPGTLVVEGESGPANQQYRIDVLNPAAPINSMNAQDILATVFATSTGSPPELGATAYTADLTRFGGQTVRLRFAEADNRGNLFAGADSVAIASTPPSNAFTFGKPVLNRAKGSARLPVSVPGGGTLQIADVKTKGKRIKGKLLQAYAATVPLPVKPTKSARKVLAAKGKVELRVAVTFTPTGGIPATQTRKLTLRLAP